MVALFVELPPERGGRQRASGQGRGAVPRCRRWCAAWSSARCEQALAAAGHRASRPAARGALGAFRPRGGAIARTAVLGAGRRAAAAARPPARLCRRDAAPLAAWRRRAPMPAPRRAGAAPMALDHPLGAARAQLHETYIVAQTARWHGDRRPARRARAARLRAHEGGAAPTAACARQVLLIPEVVELDAGEAARARRAAPASWPSWAWCWSRSAPARSLVREVPALLGERTSRGLVRDLADDLAERGDGLALKERLEAVCSHAWPAMAACAPAGG